MKHRAIAVGLFGTLGLLAAFASCVGDDPSGSDDADAGADSGPAAIDSTTQPDTGGGGDACVGCTVDAAPDAGFSPLALPGLALWLEATTGVETDAGDVAAWRDRSPNKNDATPAPGSVGPTVGTLNGKPAIVLDAKGSFVLKEKASLQWGTGDFLAVAVVAHTQPTDGGGGPSYGEILTKQITGVAPFPGPLLIANDSIALKSRFVVAVEGSGGAVVSSSSEGYNDGVTRLVGMRRKGTTLEVRVNGAGAGSTTDAGIDRDVSANGTDMFIGGHDPTVRLKGTIAEVVAVKGVTSDADLGLLEAYLIAKYGL